MRNFVRNYGTIVAILLWPSIAAADALVVTTNGGQVSISAGLTEHECKTISDNLMKPQRDEIAAELKSQDHVCPAPNDKAGWSKLQIEGACGCTFTSGSQKGVSTAWCLHPVNPSDIHSATCIKVAP